VTIEVFVEPEAHAFDLFVAHAAPDTDFVRGYLLPALNLPSARVLLMDALPVGGVMVSEIDRGVARSRFTVAVLSPAYLADRWAAFGEQLASHLSAQDVHVIPLRLLDCELPLRLDARVSLDFRDPAHWAPPAAPRARSVRGARQWWRWAGRRDREARRHHDGRAHRHAADDCSPCAASARELR
jgi:hypothetical protein